jgi:hypothetical protein
MCRTVTCISSLWAKVHVRQSGWKPNQRSVPEGGVGGQQLGLQHDRAVVLHIQCTVYRRRLPRVVHSQLQRPRVQGRVRLLVANVSVARASVDSASVEVLTIIAHNGR